MSKEKTCCVCGVKYIFCGNCGKVSYTELWRNEYCSEDCRNIFKICSRYGGKDISQEDAYNALKTFGVDKKNLLPSVKNTVDDIFNFKPVEIETIQDAQKEDIFAEPVEKEEIIVDTTVDEVVVDVVEDKPKYHKPRNRRLKRTDD